MAEPGGNMAEETGQHGVDIFTTWIELIDGSNALYLVHGTAPRASRVRRSTGGAIVLRCKKAYC